MAKKYKGITLDIGIDSKPLQEALTGVEKNARVAQSALKDIQKAAQFNGESTVLFQAKHAALADAIEATKEKLEILREADKKAKKQFESGEIGADAYAQLQREIAYTEAELQKLITEADTGINTLKKFGEGAKKIGDGMQSVGDGLSRTVTPLITGLAVAGVNFAAEADAMNSQFGQVFGDMEKTADETVNRIGEDVGSLPTRLKPAFTQMAAFGKTAGMDTADALDLAERATRAAADSAAFYDKSLEQTTESLQSFLKGNYANDAALGLSATEFTRNAAASELYGMKFKELSETQKQFTLLHMVEQANSAGGALGQAARESDQLQNRLGNLQQQAKDTLAKFAAPLIEPTVDIMKELGGVLEKVADWFGELDEGQQKFIIKMALAAAAAGPALSIGGKIVSTIGDMSNGIAGLLAEGKSLTAILAGGGGLVALMIALGAAAVVYANNADTSRNNVRKMAEATEELRQSTEKTVGGLEANAKYAKELGAELTTLNEKEKLTNDERLRAQALVDQLNGLYPELNLLIDEQSGKVSNLSDNYEDYIDSLTRSLIANKFAEETTGILEQQIDIEKKLKDAQEEKMKILQRLGLTEDEAQARLLKGIDIQGEYADAQDHAYINEQRMLGGAINAVADYTKAQEDGEKAIADVKRRQEEALAKYADKNDELNDQIGKSDDVALAKKKEIVRQSAELTDDEAKLVEEHVKRIKTYYDEKETATSKHMSRLSSISKEGYKETEISAKEWLAGMKKRYEQTLVWEENLAILVQKLPMDMVNALRESGPEQGKLAAELAKMTPEQLKPWVEQWQKNSGLAVDVANTEMQTLKGLTGWAATEAANAIMSKADEFRKAGLELPAELASGITWASGLATNASRQLANWVKKELDRSSSDAYYAGKMLATGMAKGITSHKSLPVNAASVMTRDVNSKIKQVAQIQSPSKITTEYGMYIAKGLAKGIDYAAGDAVKSSEAMMSKVLSATNQGALNLDWGALQDPDAMRATVGVDTASVRSLKQAVQSSALDPGALGSAVAGALASLGLTVQMDGRAVGALLAGQQRAGAFAKGV